jgi:hypothetical protein
MGVLMQTSGDEGGDAEAGTPVKEPVEAIFDKGAMPPPGRPDQDEVSDEEGGLAEDGRSMSTSLKAPGNRSGGSMTNLLGRS